MEEGLVEFFKSKNVDIEKSVFGFHVPPLISVDHLHMHGLGPITTIYPGWSYKYDTSTNWFKTVSCLFCGNDAAYNIIIRFM